ncbi:MAG: alkaline phosphatase family protein [Gemmatimonadota bacterium]|nr:alkaline phosphatase family protein [Gemmatimonadota bacterium]
MNFKIRLIVVALIAGFGIQSAVGQRQPKVLLIGLDGVRVDILKETPTPAIDALIADGSYNDRARTAEPTVSGPGWSSMLSGVWPDKHGVHDNSFEGAVYDRFPDFLTRIERADSTAYTFAVIDWPPLGRTHPGGQLVSDEVDAKVIIDGEELGYVEGDMRSVDVAVPMLKNSDVDAAFVYLGNIDVVGHATSSLDPAYRESIIAADEQVGMLVDAVRSRSTYDEEDWLILMSTDHGRRDDGGHGRLSEEERTIFVLVSGNSAAKGAISPAPSIVDVAVTALVHMGVELDPAWELDGISVALVAR